MYPATWSRKRAQRSIERSIERHTEKKMKQVDRQLGRHKSMTHSYAGDIKRARGKNVTGPAARLRDIRSPLPRTTNSTSLIGPSTTSDIIKKEPWSRGKKLGVGAGAATAAALAGYGAYRLWKKRRQNKQKNESLLTSLDEIREIAQDDGYEFDNDTLLLALGEASEYDNDLAVDLLYLIDDADDTDLTEAEKQQQRRRGRSLQTFAYGGTVGDTEAGGFFGGFGQSLGVGLGTAAAAGLASKKGRRSIAKFFGFGKKRPTDKQIKKMMKKVKQGGLNAKQRNKLEKMLHSVASRQPAGRNIALAMGGGAALGAGAMYSYNKWKQKRQNKKMHGMR